MPNWKVDMPVDADGSPSDGVRLDRWLGATMSTGRSQVRRWLERGWVSVDGRVQRRGGTVLQAGGEVELTLPEPCWIGGGDGLNVLGTGPGWVAVAKPAGVAVHPLEIDEAGTVLGALAARSPEIVGVGEEGELRSGVVHRLDLDTSGVMLFALEQARWLELRAAFSVHRVSKTYSALVDGRVEAHGQRVAHLAVTRHRPAFVREVAEHHEDARRCSLAWRVRGVGPTSTWVDVDLHTGFLHQVRVMFAAMGHPVLGDATYGSNSTASRAPRQMLHASAIELGDVKATCDLPADFRAVMRAEALA